MKFELPAQQPQWESKTYPRYVSSDDMLSLRAEVIGVARVLASALVEHNILELQVLQRSLSETLARLDVAIGINAGGPSATQAEAATEGE